MKSILRIFCLLSIMLAGFSLQAQNPCPGPDVSVVDLRCDGGGAWSAVVDVSPGGSDCSFFINPITGDSASFGTLLLGSFNQQGVNLIFSCNFTDSCWTTVNIIAPQGWPACDTISGVCGINYFGFNTSNTECGDASGAVEFNANSDTDYSISIRNTTTNETTTVNNQNTITGLPAATYEYVINCTDGSVAYQGSFTIDEETGFSVEVNVETTDCSMATLTAVTNVPGDYTYSWSNGATTPSITVEGGPDSLYVVQVTAENGCTVTSGGSVFFQGLRANYNVFHAECDSPTGSIWGGTWGGSAPYSYLWSDGVIGMPNRWELTPGTYSLTITDANGCTLDRTFVIEAGDVYVDAWGSLFCDGEARLYAYPSDSTNLDRYTFSWTDASGTVISTDQNVAVDAPGVYIINVTDDNGCTGADTIDVVEGQSPDIETNLVLFSGADDTIGFGCNQILVLQGANGEWLRTYWEIPGQDFSYGSYSVDPNEYGEGLYISTYYVGAGSCPIKDSLYIYPEDLICSNVSGTVYLNLDSDCSLQDGDIPLEGQQLIITDLSTSDEYYTFANNNGEYSISLPAGNYSVALGGANELIELCNPVGFTVVGGGVPLTDKNVPVVGTSDCPRVTVNTSIPLLRRCFDNAVYINYENTGTVVAENVVLTVEFGEFAGSVSNWAGVDADDISVNPETGLITATFNIGDLAPFEGGQRALSVLTCDNDFPLGAAGCVTATVTPNNPCPPADPAWTGASLRVEGSCEGDSINFVVRNVGDADMSGPLRYIVIEDGVLLSPQPFTDEPLLASDERLFTFNASGSTYHFQVEQEPLHPGLTMPTDFVEACGNGDATYGVALQFPLSDDAYWIDEECNELIGSYDPNDKRAMPRGYSENRYIEAGQMLDYTIRFQNTGTDTAFTVVVRDTLSDVYDFSTLQVTGATHPVRPVIDSSGHALAFFFDNIMLPDSFVNELASHGSVSFRIMARTDLEPATDVDNGAAIYFDFNAPVITNTYHLEIEEEFVAVSVFDFNPTVEELNVFPNPTAGVATIQLPAAAAGQELQLEVFDLLGRKQLNVSYSSGDTPQVNLAKLPAGWYSIRLSDKGNVLGTGRVLLQR